MIPEEIELAVIENYEEDEDMRRYRDEYGDAERWWRE